MRKVAEDGVSFIKKADGVSSIRKDHNDGINIRKVTENGVNIIRKATEDRH